MKKPNKLFIFLFVITLMVGLSYSVLIPSVDRAEANTLDETMWEKATFAGGCFWCMEHPFEALDGVKEVVSGYIGGHKIKPTYSEVTSGSTGHFEAVQIMFNPHKVSYKQLLDVYWRQFDPTDSGGSFVDRGNQYRSAIFYHNEKQKELAQHSKQELNKKGIFSKPVVTEILHAGPFYQAEAYHQNYYRENPLRYKFYRYRSGRDQFLEKTWGKTMTEQNTQTTSMQKNPSSKPTKEELKKRLTPLQYQVTQEEGTERPFDNAYWDNKEDGIYVDIVSGEPLFSSLDKYDSQTGWPSFSKPIAQNALVEKTDRHLFMKRTEIRSKQADSHLGHVFDDGPAPTGKRYCINSASLRFVPASKLQDENYTQFLSLFDKK